MLLLLVLCYIEVIEVVTMFIHDSCRSVTALLLFLWCLVVVVGVVAVVVVLLLLLLYCCLCT